MRLKEMLLGLLAFSLLLPACIDEPVVESAMEPLPEELELIRDRIDEFILESIAATGEPFNWNEQDDDLLLEALRVSENGLVIGYNGGASAKQILLDVIGASENIPPADRASSILFQDDVLEYFGIKILQPETLRLLREHPSVDWVEISNYPFDIERLTDEPPIPLFPNDDPPGQQMRETVLDPLVTDPNYVDQVAVVNGSLRTVMRRHNMEPAYLDYGLFGDGIDVSIIDNGLLPDRYPFFEDNGYGERYKKGYYNPWYFLPWTGPDGTQPRPTDVFGLSILIYDTYYIHGSEMMKMVLTLAPNSNIHSVRGSTWTVIVLQDQVLGIADAIRASADDPDIMVTSMSMGTIFYFNPIADAIVYHHSKGKLFVASAGSTFEGINELLGVLFPGVVPETLVATGIPNRETTGGAFELAGGSHGGPENDFTVENTSSSSMAASRTAGMISLIWSANPDLSREEVVQACIESSYFYQLNGEKDPLFGWGTMDVGYAVESILGE